MRSAADSAAVGVALDRLRRKKRGSADEAEQRFLAEQSALISDQREHLREQLKQMRLKHFGERLKVTIQMMTIALGMAIVAGLGWMAVDAGRANGVVIKPFAVAPDLARRGITGEVVASQLLDKLTDITDVARSSTANGKFGAGFGQTISLQIPETGVSLGEVERWLREKLGHEQSLAGEIVQNPDGTVTLSARLDAHALPPQTAAAADLPKLIARAAELLYAREEPRTYMQYLLRLPDRAEENQAVARGMTDSHDPVQRAYGYGMLGLIADRRGDVAEAVSNYRASDAENAGISWVVYDLASIAQGRGHQEESLRLARRVAALAPHDPSITKQGIYGLALSNQSLIGILLRDHAGTLAASIAQTRGDNLGFQGSGAAVQLQVAADRSGAHDGLTAQDIATGFAPRTSEDVAIKAAMLAFIAYNRRDWVNYLPLLDAAIKADPTVETVSTEGDRAWALSQLGRIGEAEAIVARSPLDCSNCVVARGAVANAAGRYAEADHWFAEAVRIAPSVPGPPLHWGEALMVRGDPARAAVQFREAARRSPRAEEALEGLGEALALQGDAAGAAKQFAAANALTPKWGRLHLKWGEALGKLGKADEARAQFRTAAGLDLTADEKAELAKVRT